MIDWVRQSFHRLWSFFHRVQLDYDLDAEIAAHLELAIQENLQRGMSPEEARRHAFIRFGGTELAKEQHRDTRGLPALDVLTQDLRYALRQLRLSPGFALTAMVTLALGIGATTAIFTLVHAVLLKSLPVSSPSQLYRLGKELDCCVRQGFSRSGEYAIVSNELYEYLRGNTRDFEELAAFDAGGTFLGVRRLQSPNTAETYFGQFVSGNYFAMFGVSAYAGRALSMADDTPAAPPAAVMSYRVWKQKYGLDPSVIGGVFNINAKPFTIVGVTPPSFYGHRLTTLPPDFYLPLTSEPLVKGESTLLNKNYVHWLNVIGRIRAGTNVALVEAQMRVELQQWLRSHWGEMNANERLDLPKQTLSLGPGGAGITRMRQQYGRWLHILMMVAGFVLLIVCANVAQLLLMRGMERRQRTSLRMALGARPTRLMRQALTESIVLSLLGGAAGLAVAFIGTRMILHFAFETTTQVPISATPSAPVLAFAFGVSLMTGIIFGMGPAWLATRVDPVEALRGANRMTRDAGSLPRKGLVTMQAALSVVLLSASGLLLQTLRNLEHQNIGFEQDQRMVINIDPVLAGYKPPQLESLYNKIHDSLAALPGVASVAFALYTPLSGDNWGEGIYVEGKPEPGPNADNGSGWSRVSSSFFETIGIPIIRGRRLTEQDTSHSHHVAVINEAFARKFYKNEDPVGKHFGKGAMRYAGDYEVAGVVKDARYADFDFTEPVGAFFFLPQSQSTEYAEPDAASTELRSHYLHDIVVHMQPGARLPDAQVRLALGSVDPGLPIRHIQSLEEQVASNFSQQRLIARLTSLFGILALLLASIGIYGITSYNVARRTNEIGVRMALGADRKSVLRLVLRGAFSQVAVGLAMGIPLAIAAGRLLGSQLYQVPSWDPAAPTTAVAVLAACALVASIIPAQRASSLDPAKALRSE
jgi:predicted permease